MQLKYSATMQTKHKGTENENNMTKNIKVDDDVHRDLGEIGKLSESYNDVIRRLIEHYIQTVAHERTKQQ
jgi:hypothetical protein